MHKIVSAAVTMTFFFLLYILSRLSLSLSLCSEINYFTFKLTKMDFEFFYRLFFFAAAAILCIIERALWPRDLWFRFQCLDQHNLGLFHLFFFFLVVCRLVLSKTWKITLLPICRTYYYWHCVVLMFACTSYILKQVRTKRAHTLSFNARRNECGRKRAHEINSRAHISTHSVALLRCCLLLAAAGCCCWLGSCHFDSVCRFSPLVAFFYCTSLRTEILRVAFT